MFKCIATHSETSERFVGYGETRSKAKAAAKKLLFAECYDKEFCSKAEVLSFTEFKTSKEK